jgi:N-acetylglucosamine malate deacetylase 1
MKRTILVCAAHPDDEVLGCGGAMARHADEGDTVHVVFLADGVTSRADAKNPSELDQRHAAARNALAILGARPPQFVDFPDQRLDTVPLIDITKRIEAIVKEVGPSVVYTHHTGDLNADHQIVVKAVLTATRPVPGHAVRTVLGFEVCSSTEWNFAAGAESFQPQRFVVIERQLERKMAALKAYAYEMRDFPHPRSYEALAALARFRGATIGATAAEAFRIYREIIA